MSTHADLIVVGAGAGGLVTAIRAHELGLRPIIVEAAAKVGGATAFSGGQVWTGANHVMERIGVPDSLDDVRTYVRAIAPPPDVVDPHVFEQWITRAPQVALALEEAGAIEWTYVPHLCDYEFPRTAGSKPEGRYLACGPINGATLGESRDLLLTSPHHPPGPTWEELFAVWGDGDKVRELNEARATEGVLTFGTGLAAHFYRAVLARGIIVLTQHRATELTLTGDTVTGVICETPSGTVELSGPVVLATGTYDWNDEFVREYSGLEPQQTGSVAPPSLMGDGIVLGRQAGANIFKMPLQSSVHVSGYQALEPSGDDNGYRFCLQLSFPHSFMVDADGRRFCDDSYYRSISHAILTEGQRSHLPYFLIWDENHHKRYGLDPAGPGEPYPAPMHVASAPTIEELATELGIDPDTLAATTARFNEHAAAGVDPDFHRGENTWAANFLGDPSHKPSTILGPVEDAPFYGMPMRLVGTAVGAAGVHAGTDGQALRPDGSSIPGLYAIGAAAAFTTSGTGYNSGMALSRAITFGYLVAEHAAADKAKVKHHRPLPVPAFNSTTK